MYSRVCVVGLGYIGLPTATVLAGAGLEVVGVDVNARVVDSINDGIAHIVEPQLAERVASLVGEKRLRATREVEPADAFILAVPTPLTEDKQPDLSYVESATRSIAPALRPGNLVVLESTSPVGTTERMCALLAAERPDLRFPPQAGDEADIRVAYCPERVLPGNVLAELVENPRIVGGMSARCTAAATALYKTFIKSECHSTDVRTAELAKLTENAYRDLNIAFANELSLVCAELDVNVWELIELANLHPRVNVLQPGPGVGGHCIAVDPWFIVSQAPETARLIRMAREVNDRKPGWVVEEVQRKVAHLTRPTVACLGLSYKANIDDLRESPAIVVVKRLAELGIGPVMAVEPHIRELPATLAESGVELADLGDALEAADVVVLLVDHQGFRDCSRSQLANKIVVDTRGIW